MKAQKFFKDATTNIFSLLVMMYPEQCEFMVGVEDNLYEMYKIRSTDKIVNPALLDVFGANSVKIFNYIVDSLYLDVEKWDFIFNEHKKLLTKDILSPIQTVRTTEQTINDKINAYDSGEIPSDKSEQNLNKTVIEQTNTIKSYSDYFQIFLDFERQFNFLSIIFNSIDKHLFLSVY